MLKRLLLLVILICASKLCALGQINSHIDKVTLAKNTVIRSSINDKNEKSLEIINSSTGLTTNSIKYSDLESGLLVNHPLSWDVAHDSILFVIRTYSDQLGMTYTDLLTYNVNTIKKLEQADLRQYLFDNSRIAVKHIAPLFMYCLRIAYRADTLKGPVFFDIRSINHDLLLYVYLNDNNSLEKWRFNWYPAYVQQLAPEDIIKLHKMDQWEKVATYSISLTAPFKAFSQGRKEYILNNANEIYELNQNAKAVPLDKTKKTSKRNVIIVDKAHKKVRTIPQEKFDGSPELKTGKSIIKASKPLKINH
jgi:hypothetical protein